MKKQQIKELTDREWLLIRGHNIIGSLQPVQQQSFLYDSTLKRFEWTSYEYIPGLVKIINEILDNSLDVAIKSNFKFANEISIEISDTKVVVSDNGFGIPVEKTPEGKWLPEIAWGRARAGSNFEDDKDRKSVGLNGIGSYSTNVFSKRFTGVTDDGKNRLVVKSKNNASICETELQPTKNNGTTVSFFPDLIRFGLETIDELHKSLIYQRILNLSVLYPQIKFKFNKRLVKIDSKKFLALFSDSFEFIEEDDYFIGVFPNTAADFSYHSYINGLWLEKGGNHINFLTSKIVEELRNKLSRKFKSIKPGDIKNKISVIVFFRNFPNAKFDGQTKEYLTNTQKDITSFLNFNDQKNKKDWEKFTTKLYKNRSIVDPITDLYRAKMLVEEKRKLKAAAKNRDTPEKYWPATKEKKYLFLSEGDSAVGSVAAELGRDYVGYFPLRGVVLNVVKDRKKLATNSEIQQIASILNMDLSLSDNKEMTYENIVFAVDADTDGVHIAGLLLGIFKEFTLSYLQKGSIFLFITPIVTVKNKKGQYKFLFTMQEYEDFRNKYDKTGSKFIYDYKKGLGSLEESEWQELFKQFQLEKLLKPLHLKNSSNPEIELEELNKWLADDVQFRKEKIVKHINTFDINKI